MRKLQVGFHELVLATVVETAKDTVTLVHHQPRPTPVAINFLRDGELTVVFLSALYWRYLEGPC